MLVLCALFLKEKSYNQ